MNDRKALAKALKKPWPVHWEKNSIIAAARERLAQLPEPCGTCGGSGCVVNASNNPHPRFLTHPDGVVDDGCCLPCHGRGTVYPPALVSVVAGALMDYEGDTYEGEAVAVLDALYQFPAPEEVGKL